MSTFPVLRFNSVVTFVTHNNITVINTINISCSSLSEDLVNANNSTSQSPESVSAPTCTVCHHNVSLTKAGVIRMHGPTNLRCSGSHKPPVTSIFQPGLFVRLCVSEDTFVPFNDTTYNALLQKHPALPPDNCIHPLLTMNPPCFLSLKRK